MKGQLSDLLEALVKLETLKDAMQAKLFCLTSTSSIKELQALIKGADVKMILYDCPNSSM